MLHTDLNRADSLMPPEPVEKESSLNSSSNSVLMKYLLHFPLPPIDFDLTFFFFFRSDSLSYSVDLRNADLAQSTSLLECNSIISDVFMGQLKVTRKCTTCQSVRSPSSIS